MARRPFPGPTELPMVGDGPSQLASARVHPGALHPTASEPQAPGSLPWRCGRGGCSVNPRGHPRCPHGPVWPPPEHVCPLHLPEPQFSAGRNLASGSPAASHGLGGHTRPPCRMKGPNPLWQDIAAGQHRSRSRNFCRTCKLRVHRPPEETACGRLQLGRGDSQRVSPLCDLGHVTRPL